MAILYKSVGCLHVLDQKEYELNDIFFHELKHRKKEWSMHIKKFWWLPIIAADIALTNTHQLFTSQAAEVEWHVWDMSMAGRVCLIPIVMLIQQKLDKWGELAVCNYFCFSVLDLVQTVLEKNEGLQAEELLAFLMLNTVMFFKWKQQ